MNFPGVCFCKHVPRNRLFQESCPIILLAIAQTLIWACLYYSFPALLLQWEQALGWSRAELTAAITLSLFISAFSAPLGGRLIDAGKGPLMMTLSSLLGGACLMLLALVDQLWQFYLLWGLIGLCMSGSLYEPCFALITRARGVAARQAIMSDSAAQGVDALARRGHRLRPGGNTAG